VTPQLADEDFRAVMESSRPRLKSGELILVMADTLPMQMDQLKDGLSNVQVGQRPYEMGYRAMFVLRDLVNGKSDIDDPIYTDLDICTAENADSCIFGKGGPLIQSKN
jgi:ribose transport system substrate-binding protein